MASYLKQMEELEKLKKKTEQITEKLKTAKQTGASSGAPSSSQKTVIGPTQWNPNSTITTLPKAGGTMPKAANNVLPKAEDGMSNLERASRIGNIEVSDSIKSRGDNIVKGLGTSLAASPALLLEATKQSLGDWNKKVKTEGMEKALTDYAYNLDNPNYDFGSSPIDTNSKAYQNYAKSQEYYAKALEGLTPAQQRAGQLGISMLESASTLPTAFINPSAPLLLMGTKAAANRAYELTNEGKSATEAAGRGILSGAIEALTEKIPLDDLLKAAKGGRSVVKNLLKQANVEGAEELTSYIMNYAADVSANDKNAHFSPKEAFENYAGGFVSGGIMGGAAAAIGNYMPTYEQIMADNIVNNGVLPRVDSNLGALNAATNVTNKGTNITADTTQNASEQTLNTIVSKPTTKPANKAYNTKETSQQGNLQQSQFVAVEGTKRLQKSGLTDGKFNYYKKNGKWITVAKNGTPVNKPVNSINTAIRESNKISFPNILPVNTQQTVSNVLPTPASVISQPIRSTVAKTPIAITQDVLPTVNETQTNAPTEVYPENNINIAQVSRQSIPMAKGGGKSSVSGTVFSDKAQRTVSNLKDTIKELKYQQRFQQAENDLASRMAVGKAKAETARKYQVKIDKLNELLVQKGHNIKQLKFDKKELEYQNRFKQAENDLASRMAIGRAKAESKRLNAEKLMNNAQSKKQTKVTSDILKIARKLESAKLSNEEKTRLNAVLADLDTYGKKLSNKQAYTGMLARDYIEQMKAEYPDYVPEPEIQAMVDRLDKVRVSELTPYEALDYLNALKAIQTDFNNRNKMLADNRFAEVKAAADNAIVTINRVKNQKDNIATRIYDVESLNMSTLLDRLGNFANGSFVAVKDSLLKGQRKKVLYEKQAQEIFNDFLTNPDNAVEINKWNGKNAEWIDTGLKFSDGTSVEITPLYRIDLYMHSKCKDNLKALLNGGYVVPRKENLLKGKEIDRNSEAIKLTEADIADITNKMTEKEKQFADLLSQYYNGMSKKSINEVSNVLLGYDAAGVENYYPLTRSRDFLHKEYDGEGQASIINPGFLKERTGNTSVPIKAGNALDVLLKSINDTSTYYGMALPLRDLKSMLNSTGSGEVRLEKVISDKYGKSVSDYINKWITEVNSGSQQKYFLDNLSGKLFKNYAQAVLSFNPKVTLEQPSALITAAPALGYNNIMKAIKPQPKITNEVIRQVDARSGYRWDRGVRGNSRGELSELANKGDFKYNNNNVLPKIANKINPINWINEMDLYTTDKVAVAAYYKVKDDMGISINSANFWDYVTDEYNNALETTQAMYNIMQRNGISRSGSTAAKALNMFSTERNKHYNMMYDAIGKYKAAKQSSNIDLQKQSGKYLRNTASAIMISTIWGTALDVATGILRRRKEYEDEKGNISLPKVGKDFAQSYIGNLIGNVFLGSQIYSSLANIFLDEYMYDVSEPTLDMINDFLKDITSMSKTLKSYIGGAIEAKEQNVLPRYLQNEKTQLLNSVRQTAHTASNMLGIPLKNAERTIMTAIGVVSPETRASYENLFNDLNNSYLSNSASNVKDLNTRNALKDRVSNDLDDITLNSITKLYNKTNDNNVLPLYNAPSKIQINETDGKPAKDYELSLSDKYDYLDTYSDVLEKELPSLIRSDYYKKADTEEKTDVVKKLYTYAEKKAKNKVLDVNEELLPFVPETAGLTDERQSAAINFVKAYGSKGFGYDDYADIYEKYAELNKEDLTAREKATELEEFLAEEGYPRGVDITNDLRNEFRFYSMAPADSYYDSKNYQMVQSFMPVDVYADLSGTLNKMESGVDYPKGERSPYYKSAIDQYLAEYGYNPTYNQRMKIYESMGVAKKYRY